MTKTMLHECRTLFLLAGSAAALLTAGCGGMTTTATAIARQGPQLNGTVFGGRQPIAGATILLYAANNTAYGATNANILTKTVSSNPDGTFTITGAYSCAAGQQMYIVALGGNAGSGTNPQAGIMAALGDCANLSASTFISMNEVTTVGSVFALAPFMKSYASIGTSAGNVNGLTRAFASVTKLVNTATGQQYGSALPANAAGPSAEIATLADVLASCVNSIGGAAGDGSNCGKLFSLVTPSGATAPTNTIDAAMMIAHNPAFNAGAIFALSSSAPPFNPTLAAAPTDWTMSVIYRPTGLVAPATTTLDGSNQVWVADSTANRVTVLTQAGAPATVLAGNGLSGPDALALDSAGNAWVANNAAGTVSAFTSTGARLGNSPFTVGSAPSSLAFDGSGHLFVANTGSNSISILSTSGASLGTITTGVTAPSAVVVDPK